jgi:hypothetical protein
MRLIGMMDSPYVRRVAISLRAMDHILPRAAIGLQHL